MLVAIPHLQAIQLLVLDVLQDSFGIQLEIHVIQPAKLMIQLIQLHVQNVLQAI